MLSCTYVLRSELWTLESTKVDGSEGDENDVAQRTKYRGIVASILTAFTYFGTVNSSLDKFGKIDPATSTVLHRAVHPHAQIETPRTHCVVAIIWKRPVRTVFCRHKDRSREAGEGGSPLEGGHANLCRLRSTSARQDANLCGMLQVAW